MLRSITLAAPLVLLAAAFVSYSIGDETLTPGQPLADDGRTLISVGQRFALGFFSPGKGSQSRYIGIWYHGIADGKTVVWVANRQRPVVGRFGRLSLASNGTLVITDGNSTVIWSSSSPAVANPVAQLLDDGNFVVREGESGRRSRRSAVGWQSFDFPTDTIIPGMRLGWNLTSRVNHNLTAWKSASDPAPGDYVAGFDLNGNPQVCLWSGMKMIWRGGPWNGERFVGIEGMKRDSGFGIYYKFVWDATELSFTFSLNPSVVNRLVMNSSGIIGNLLWIEEKKTWRYVGFQPRDECDSISRCGPYSVCHPDGSSLCRCLPGFFPGNLQDDSDGCVRKTALDCRTGTDGFAVQSNVKLPDTSNSTVDWSASPEQCRDRCLKNCACTAYARANISDGGGGCIIWTTELTDMKFQSGSEQDLYVRLAAADLESSHSHQRHAVIIIVLPLVLTIFLLSGVAYCVWRRKKSVEETQGEEDFDLPLYNLATIEEATGNFCIENKLGQGGFGPVYKGKLREGHEIAVKRLSTTSSQGVEEFKNEALLIAKLQHKNLVRLLGCCIQGGERMLIYEYMANGSLDSLLFDEAKSALLDWQTRFNIIVGIARALLYMHHDSRLTIIHRDLKASNVLLDKDINPKISDFGMARIFRGDDTEVNTRRVVGTYGYMSPEYAMNGIFSIKSDVFSFGVLVLEIITGIRNRGNHRFLINQNLLEYVWSLWKEDRALDAIDRTIGKSFHKGEVLSCIKIGLLCVQERPGDRPTIYSVVKMLGNDGVLLPEPKEPSIFTLKTSSEASSSTSKTLTSVNNMSMTILNPR